VTTTTSPADAWWAPIETVSNSEAGFERVYQGSALLLSWPVRLARGERWTRTIVNTVATARDRAEDDT
jgi:alpha-amylase